MAQVSGRLTGSRERSPSAGSSPVGFDPGRSDFSIGDVLAWARTKPADETYVYSSPSNCAMCQFLRETGRAVSPTVCSNKWDEGRVLPKTPFDDRIREAANCHDYGAGHPTFGKLVARLEALAPELIIPPSEWTRLDSYMADIEMVNS